MNNEKRFVDYLKEIKEKKERELSKAKKNEEIVIKTINELENW